MQKVQKLLSRRQVKEVTTLSYAHIQRLEDAKRFPRRIKLTESKRGRVAWAENEVMDWVANRANGRTSPP